MKILVCIKQIPDTNDVKWSKDNNIIRDGVISILNPYDLFGILTAKQIKKNLGDIPCEIILLSMGPKSAVNSIREGIATGADRGILLSDKKFSGSDTLATAKTLSCAIKNVVKDFDLIITGQFALDGDTAQVPYSLANLLQIPIIGFVNEVESVKENEIVVKSVKDDGIYKIKGNFPVLLSVSKFEGEVYKPLAADYIRAQDSDIKILDSNDILINCDISGIKGSPTYVSKAFRPKTERKCRFVECTDLIGELK